MCDITHVVTYTNKYMHSSICDHRQEATYEIKDVTTYHVIFKQSKSKWCFWLSYFFRLLVFSFSSLLQVRHSYKADEH